MNDAETYLASGILEMYALGLTSPHESREAEAMLERHEILRNQFRAIQESLRSYAEARAVSPPPTVKPLLQAIIRYQERLKGGEEPGDPPILRDNASTREEFAAWLDREDLQRPELFRDLYAHIIGMTEKAITAIVWIGQFTPPETHDDVYEKFLILEGSCTIYVGDEQHLLSPGSCLTIPLHRNHYVKVTSASPCKAILQRVAA